MAQNLHDVIQYFNAEDYYFVCVVYGENGTFCSGANLQSVSDTSSRHDLSLNSHSPAPLGLSRLIPRKPVIAAIEGYCVAGGLELACFCDLRVGSKDSTYGVFCRRFGVPLVDLGTIRLPRLIGLSRAMDMVLTGRAVTAKEAYEWGLLNRLVPKGETLREALKLAESLCEHPQRCMRNDRHSMLRNIYGSQQEFDQQIISEMEFGRDSIQAEEFGKALDRFVIYRQGRHGSFEGLAKL